MICDDIPPEAKGCFGVWRRRGKHWRFVAYASCETQAVAALTAMSARRKGTWLILPPGERPVECKALCHRRR